VWTDFPRKNRLIEDKCISIVFSPNPT